MPRPEAGRQGSFADHEAGVPVAFWDVPANLLSSESPVHTLGLQKLFVRKRGPGSSSILRWPTTQVASLPAAASVFGGRRRRIEEGNGGARM